MNRTYKASIYIDRKPSPVKVSGMITIFGNSLIFQSHEERVKVPLDGLDIYFGGTANRIIYFKHSVKSESVIHTDDHSILKDEALIDHPSLPKVKASKSKHKNSLILVGGLCLLLMLSSIYFLLINKAPLANFAAQFVSVESETKLGNFLYGLHLSSINNTWIQDPQLNEQLNVLVQPLVESIDHKGYEFTFHIVQDETPNAYAMPGGYIFFHTGLFEKSDSVEEVLGITAHEIAHVLERHTLKSALQAIGTNVFLFVIGVDPLIAEAGKSVNFLTRQAFSRHHETEADEVGFEYLVNAGISPIGLITFFEKLDKEASESKLAGVEESGMFNLISTHPMSKKRVENLKALTKQLDLYKVPLPPSNTKNYMNFKKSLKEYLEKPKDKE